MFPTRRILLAGLLLVLSACAQGAAKGPVDAAGRPLEADRGMLFEFETAEEQGFWMKNTPSSLDILYIDPAGRIVSIARHATPHSEVPIPSNGAANGVLELRAGRADEIGARPGDTVSHPFFRP